MQIFAVIYRGQTWFEIQLLGKYRDTWGTVVVRETLKKNFYFSKSCESFCSSLFIWSWSEKFIHALENFAFCNFSKFSFQFITSSFSKWKIYVAAIYLFTRQIIGKSNLQKSLRKYFLRSNFVLLQASFFSWKLNECKMHRKFESISNIWKREMTQILLCRKLLSHTFRWIFFSLLSFQFLWAVVCKRSKSSQAHFVLLFVF